MPETIKIRNLKPYEYELSKSLWMECFPEDGREFVDWYYAERSKPEYVLGAFADDDVKPVSMMHILPMRMRFAGADTTVGFVAGVCTAPKLRGKGLCSELFEHAFKIMRDRGYSASVLQPFDTSFYERYGYKSFIKRRVYSLSDECANQFGRMTDEQKSHWNNNPDPILMLEMYNRFTKDFSGCSLRTEEYFNGLINEYSLPGAMLIISENACCAGYSDNDSFYAYELYFDDPADIARVLPKGYKKYVLPVPVTTVLPQFESFFIEEFSMLKPLSESFETGDGPFYGFDKY